MLHCSSSQCEWKENFLFFNIGIIYCGRNSRHTLQAPFSIQYVIKGKKKQKNWIGKSDVVRKPLFHYTVKSSHVLHRNAFDRGLESGARCVIDQENSREWLKENILPLCILYRLGYDDDGNVVEDRETIFFSSFSCDESGWGVRFRVMGNAMQSKCWQCFVI